MKNYILFFLIGTISVNAQINPQDYGVKFDGSGESTNAAFFQVAIDSANATGQDIHLPYGSVVLNSGLNIPSGVKFKGSGIHSTMIQWNWDYTGTGMEGTNLDLEGFTIKRDSIIGGTAIKCNGGNFKANSIQIWNHHNIAIELNGCDTVSIKRSRLLGSLNDSHGHSTEALVKFTGVTNHVEILDSHLKTTNSGVLIQGNCQDFLYKNTSCTNMDYGIRFNPASLSQNIVIENADISGCNISSVFLKKVKNVLVKNVYGVVRNYDGTNDIGTFHVEGSNTENVLFEKVIVNNNNESAASSGIQINEGANIKINYFSSANATYPVTVKSAANNVIIKGAIRRKMNNEVLYNIQDSTKVKIVEFTHFPSIN